MQKIHIIALLTAVISASTCPLGMVAAEAPSTLNPAIWAQMSAPDANMQSRRAGTRLKPDERPNGLTEISSILFAGAENDPNLSPQTNAAGTRELFFKMMASVVLVVVLGAVAIYASKRLVGKIANLPGKKIKIVETAHLGPKKAVHLLRIGDRCLLIGSTNDNITKLADLTTEIMMQEKALAEDTGPAEMHEIRLSTEFGPALEPADALANLSTK